MSRSYSPLTQAPSWRVAGQLCFALSTLGYQGPLNKAWEVQKLRLKNITQHFFAVILTNHSVAITTEESN
jgi:hypothetical protein